MGVDEIFALAAIVLTVVNAVSVLIRYRRIRKNNRNKT